MANTQYIIEQIKNFVTIRDVFDKYVEMKDDKFLNIYDNYENLAYNGSIRGDSDFYNGFNTGGYFGNNGLYR